MPTISTFYGIVIAMCWSDQDSAAALELRPQPRAPWRLVKLTELPDYRLGLGFRDGTEGVIDLKATIFSERAGGLTALRDENLFRAVDLELGAPVWPGEIDLAPDVLYDGAKASLDGTFRL